MDPKLKEILDRLTELDTKAASLAEKLNSDPTSDDYDAVKADLKSAKEEIETLLADKKAREEQIEKDALKADVKAMKDRLEGIAAEGGAILGGSGDPEPQGKKTYGKTGGRSYFADVKAASKGDYSAFQRLEEALEASGYDAKAMTEGTDSAGGYLVNPEISDELIRLRLQGSRIRQLCSSVDVQSDSLQIASITGGLTAGWVAELAAKPSADMTFGQLTTNVYTMAGLATVSNQLLADSRPSVDGLITSDIAYRLAVLEEQAILNGDATGKPRGILQTAGINSTVYTDASPTGAELADAVYDAITQVRTTYFGDPSHIVMHPRTWAFLSKSKATDGSYLLGSGANAGGRRPSDGIPGPSLFGYPIVLTNNVPTTLGGGTESAVIVGDFSQALILDRQGLTVDSSEHVNFTTNQTVFRVEARMGFTAARYPKAFAAVTGTGLAGN